MSSRPTYERVRRFLDLEAHEQNEEEEEDQEGEEEAGTSSHIIFAIVPNI